MVGNDETALASVPARERRWLLRALHDETVGGLLLMALTVVAIAWANSPWASSYTSFTTFAVGPPGLHLTMTEWASDLLLAVFFFVVGIELKHEIVDGSLANPRRALVPIAAAVGGMATSAAIYVAVNRGTSAVSAWAVPISTDVAFALAVLAVFGRRLPLELRAFLLTLAVVNDLGAITVIALFYGHRPHLAAVAGAAAAIAVFAWLQHSGRRSLVLHVPLAAAAWILMYRSGIHATVAGVALGLSMQVRATGRMPPAESAHRVLRPLSAGLCVPGFALVAAGIPVHLGEIGSSLREPLLLGIVLGLVLGQPLGVTAGAFIAARLTRSPLNPGLTWWDIAVVGTLASIGFTVALLVSQVSFVSDAESLNTAKLAVVLANLSAIAVAVTAMSLRTAVIGRYRR